MKIDKKRLIAEAKKRASNRMFDLEKLCFEPQLNFIKDKARFKTAVCSRRCLAKGTLIQTTLGPKKIEEINVGDFVYDENGSPIKVKEVFFNGEKEVIEVLHNTRLLFKATKDHVMLTKTYRSDKLVEKPLKHFYKGLRIVRKEVNREGGINVPYAYSIGAMLGDGCSTQDSKNCIYISSSDDKIPNRVLQEFNGYDIIKCKGGNFSYRIKLDQKPEEYTLWCAGKYAHEKTCDIKRILSWNRESRLRFLAGLMDTDGSVCIQPDGIQIRLTLQAFDVIKCAQMLFLDLFNYEPSIYVDNRDKYKNGPVYNLNLKHNYFGKKVITELDPYMLSIQKKWKEEYSLKRENNHNAKYMGVRFGNTSIEPTYDIHVDSTTNLYLLANGLVTHNSGKTTSIALDMINTCTVEKNVICLYVALTSRSARSIIWGDLKRLIDEYSIEVKTDETRLTIQFLQTGSEIRLGGAKDEVEIEKYRGWKLKKVYIDEAQYFRQYLTYFINDIIMPALRDLRGSIAVTGTPGPVLAGPFFEITHNDKWAKHHWTAFENPHMLDLETTLREEREVKGITEDDPGYIRETYGKWVEDTNSLVYRFDRVKNVYEDIPASDIDTMDFIFGIDIGFEDSDAIAVLGYSRASKNVYLVEEFIKNKLSITELANEIKRLQEFYKPVKMVMDAGALGKKIQDEIRTRHQLHCETAEKNRKLEFIELLNDDLRTAKLKAKKGSRFEQDCFLVQWEKNNGKRQISTAYHTDIGDAVLYAWRECKHFLHESKQPRVSRDSSKFMEDLEEKLAQEMEDSKNVHELDMDIDLNIDLNEEY